MPGSVVPSSAGSVVSLSVGSVVSSSAVSSVGSLVPEDASSQTEVMISFAAEVGDKLRISSFAALQSASPQTVAALSTKNARIVALGERWG